MLTQLLLRKPSRSAARTRRAAATVALLVTVAAPAHAQYVGEDASSNVVELSDMLKAPSDVRLNKKRAAKDSYGWIATVVGAAGAGFDSNIYESPNNVKKSPFGMLGSELSVLRYLDDANRIEATASVTTLQYTKTSKISPTTEQVELLWGNRRTRSYSLTTTVGAKHTNDASTNIDGDNLVSDYAYFSYDGGVSLWLYPGRDQAIRLSADAERRDYNETRSVDSLDWWKAGPKVAYHYDFNDAVQTQAYYAFEYQRYDANRATGADGIVPLDGPDEEHYFHKAGAELESEFGDTLATDLEYDFRMKDDRYQDYESYKGHEVTARVDWTPFGRWGFVVRGSYQYRDYDKRPADDGRTLHYNRWEALARAVWRWSDHVSLFVDYEFGLRDTNRGGPSKFYRDYQRHVTTAGVSLWY